MSALRMHERDQAAWIRRRHGSPPAADVPPKHRRPLVSLADSCSPLSRALSGGFGVSYRPYISLRHWSRTYQLEYRHGPTDPLHLLSSRALEQRQARRPEGAAQLKDIWAIRVRLQLGERARELALFNLAIDSKLRSCDLVKLRVRDVTHGIVLPHEQLSCSREPSDLCSLKSQSRRENPWVRGFGAPG